MGLPLIEAHNAIEFIKSIVKALIRTAYDSKFVSIELRSSFLNLPIHAVALNYK